MLARARQYLASPSNFELCPPCHARIRYHALLLHLQETRKPFRHASATPSRAVGYLRGQTRSFTVTRSLAILPEFFPDAPELPVDPSGRYSRKRNLQAQELIQQLQEESTAQTHHDHDPQRAVNRLVETIINAGNADPVIWAAFQELSTVVHDNGLGPHPAENESFMSAGVAFTVRCVKRWLQSSPIAELHGHPLRPSEVVVYLELAQFPARRSLPRVLAKLADSVVRNADINPVTARAHLEELTAMWWLAFALKADRNPKKAPSGVPIEWPAEIAVDASQRPTRTSGGFLGPLDSALRPVLPATTSYNWSYYYGAAELTLAALVRHADPNKPSPLAMDPADKAAVKPLLQFLDAAMMRDCKPFIPGYLFAKLTSENETVRRPYEEAFAEIFAQARPSLIEGQGDTFGSQIESLFPKTSDQTEQEQFTNAAHTRLSRSLEMHNHAGLDRVTADIVNASRDKTFKVEDSLFERALLGQYELRNPTAAMKVYEAFLASGSQPNAGLFRAMMQGAGRIRDYPAAEKHWRVMRNCGIQPDAKAWGIRVYNLACSGPPEIALEALKQMGLEWLKAAQHRYLANAKQSKQAPKVSGSALVTKFSDDIDGVPRPDIAVANGAIAGLVARRAASDIPKVLSWCTSFGVKPDSVTYNSLLNLCLREGDIREANALLIRMEAEGITVDSTTSTILLTNLVEDGSLEGLSQKEQHDKVMTLMTSLENDPSASINAKGYAMLIDRMIKRYNNPQTANAILVRMTERGLEPTPHIYTILMTKYFQDSDLPAVEALWNRVKALNNHRLDHYFYDRMIEGYARHHDVVGMQPAFTFINHMLQTNRKPSWQSLCRVAEALAERHDWSRLNQLTEDVLTWERESGGRGLHIGEKELGRSAFWRFCLSTTQHGNSLLDVARAQSIVAEAWVP